LWAGLAAISELKKDKLPIPIRYILVTREQNPYGWRLRDLAKELDIQSELVIFERGVPQKDLWGLYVMSDVYLQPSKAEGLGLPVLDAMACGIPCVATDTGALHELLENGRGHLILSEYEFRDVWGNEARSMINISSIKKSLWTEATTPNPKNPPMERYALEYVQSRTWDIPAKQLYLSIKEILHEPA
jgi:glycosyltransferase involved in cell wall biosynthesis